MRRRYGGTSLAWIALAFTLVVWALPPPAIRVVIRWYSPGGLALLRCLVASAAFAVYAVVRRLGVPAGRDLAVAAVSGLANVTGYHLYVNQALVTVPAAVTSVLTNIAPVFTALFAVTMLSERMSPRQWMGILTSFAGVAVIASGQWRAARLGPELLLPLAGALCWAVSTALQKPLIARIGPERVTVYSVWAGTLALLPFLPALPAEMARVPLAVTLGVVLLGLGPIALAYMTWAYALAHIDASLASATFYLIPVLVALIGWAWLREMPSTQTVVGGVLCIAGVAMVQARRRRSAAQNSL